MQELGNQQVVGLATPIQCLHYLYLQMLRYLLVTLPDPATFQEAMHPRVLGVWQTCKPQLSFCLLGVSVWAWDADSWAVLQGWREVLLPGCSSGLWLVPAQQPRLCGEVVLQYEKALWWHPRLSMVCWKIRKLQNGWGWQGPLELVWSKPCSSRES